MNAPLLRYRAPLIAAAIFASLAAAALIVWPIQSSNPQDFHAGVDGSVASQTIETAAVSDWDVELEIIYSDRQKQLYLEKVSRRIVSTVAGETWRPIQHLPLSLTVSTLENGAPHLVHEETIESEPFYGGGDHAGFLAISQLHLDPGKYLVSIRALKGDPTLGKFGARLLVGRRWEEGSGPTH